MPRFQVTASGDISPLAYTPPPFIPSGTRPLLLDVCSCAGVGADGYVEAGFEVVCLDNNAKALQHNPHHSICGDAFQYLADRGFMAQFDAIHASFPCQGYSATQELAIAQGKGASKKLNLVEPGRDALNATDLPWIMENVERSPLKHWHGAVRLCGSSWGLKVQRHRIFAPSHGLTLHGSICDHSTFDIDPDSGKPRPWGIYYAMGDDIPFGGHTCDTLEHGMECMGVTRTLPWDYLKEGLPPAYTKYLGLQLLSQL